MPIFSFFFSIVTKEEIFLEINFGRRFGERLIPIIPFVALLIFQRSIEIIGCNTIEGGELDDPISGKKNLSIT